MNPTAGDESDNFELLKGLRVSDPHAFDVLVARFEAPLYRFFYYAHGQHDRAEDECGETFAQLVQAFHRMRGTPESLRAFVFGVARNVQRRGWRTRPVAQLDEDYLAEVVAPGPSAFETLSHREQVDQALALIRQFDDPERQVLLLRFVEEFKLEEISAALGIPLNTVKSILHRSCARLRQQMQANETNSGRRA